MTYEYTILATPQPLVQEMNKLGEVGWDIFKIEKHEEAGAVINAIYAKRPIVVEQPPN